MNRIETKIIITVTNRLAAAKESDAKTDLIEELSENLYQRYLDLAASGLSEQEALKQAMDSLGDVQELLDYLKEEEMAGSMPAKDDADGAQETGPHCSAEQSDGVGQQPFEEQSFDETKRQQQRTAQNEGFNFKMEDLEEGIESIVNAAISTARVATDYARDVAKDVSEQFKERYPDGINVRFGRQSSRVMDCTCFAGDSISAIDISLANGDVRICVSDDENAPIEVVGDTDEIETIIGENGTLIIRQGATASSTFFFMRGMRYSDLEVVLPLKLWESISVRTTNGDIHMDDELACRKLFVTAARGDVFVGNVSCEQMELQSASGDVRAENLKGSLRAESKSGDVDVDGRFACCELISVSGDVSFAGEAAELIASSTSGDVHLSPDVQPAKIKAASVSGDCHVKVPGDCGFKLSYRTSCGEFDTNLDLTGILREKRGDVTYLVNGNPGSAEIEMSSVSGDLHLTGN